MSLIANNTWFIKPTGPSSSTWQVTPSWQGHCQSLDVLCTAINQLLYCYYGGYYHLFSIIITRLLSIHSICTIPFDSPLDMGENWGLEKLRNSSRVSKQANGRAEIHSEYCSTSEANFKSPRMLELVVEVWARKVI